MNLFTSGYDNYTGEIIVDDIKYKKKILCNDVKLINNLMNENRLKTAKIDEYSLECSNESYYATEQPFASGGFNNVYEIKNKNEIKDENKILRVTKRNLANNSNFNRAVNFITKKIGLNKNEQLLHDEIEGLFLQCYMHKKCPDYICKIYEFGFLKSEKGEKRVYAILEKLKYSNIAKISIKDNPNHNLKQLIQQALEGLKCMNEENFVHLDIKQDNIGIGNDDKAKIFDFGFARYLPNNPTKADTVFGSRFFVDPERLLLRKTYLNADIYAFGNMLINLYISQDTINRVFKNENREKNNSTLLQDSKLPQKYIDYFEKKYTKSGNRTQEEIKELTMYFVMRLYGTRELYQNLIELVEEDDFKTNDIYKEEASRIYNNDDESIQNDTKNMIDLIKNMMKYDANARFTSEQSLRHKWFGEILNENVHDNSKIDSKYTDDKLVLPPSEDEQIGGTSKSQKTRRNNTKNGRIFKSQKTKRKNTKKKHQRKR